ncbi:hypothetical protein [Rhizobium rhizogenes]|uniref:hypothetical protein n=1 Tax=Rhizobium rhizogenes TaxID=359 RepID=UPI00157314C5|nr:hypothetical protein [Rhizobium rhizogenes]NTF67941.1 hypothetical protein [Rhizobium rhizogenes]
MSIVLQSIFFFIIAANFIFLVLAVIEPWLRQAFPRPMQRREAQIIPFPVRSRIRRDNHV